MPLEQEAKALAPGRLPRVGARPRGASLGPAASAGIGGVPRQGRGRGGGGRTEEAGKGRARGRRRSRSRSPSPSRREPSESSRGRRRDPSAVAAASAPPPAPLPARGRRQRRGRPAAGRWAAGVMASPEPLRPRLCRLVRGEHGYGFHLHGEKGRRGQFIRRVEPGSPAEAAALRAGDRLVEVNGVNVEGETHHQVGARAPPPARCPAGPPPRAGRGKGGGVNDRRSRHCLPPGLGALPGGPRGSHKALRGLRLGGGGSGHGGRRPPSSPLPLRQLRPAPRRGHPGREGPALRLLALGPDT